MDSLFPPLPEDLAALTDEELSGLLDEHKIAFDKIEALDPDYLGDLGAAEILEESKTGLTQVKALRAERDLRAEAQKNFQEEIVQMAAEAREEPTVEEVSEVVAEAEQITAEETEEPSPETETEEAEAVLVAAAPVFRRPPAPDRSRQPIQVNENPGAVLVASAGLTSTRAGTPLDAIGLAVAMHEEAKRRGPVKHVRGGTEERIPVAVADFPFPKERVLGADVNENLEKLTNVGIPFFGERAREALVASGGLCAPATPFYNIPDFAVTDRPVRGALPSYRAERGAVSVPAVSTIGDITTAITVIEESDDALGGTFATKSCQDLSCPSWTDVAVGIIAHCREYGNLGARAWPEGIAHENNLTMAALARTAETRLLNRIKALSINVTTADVYSSTHDLIYAITRAAAGIRYRLRLGAGAPALRALLPAWVPGMLVADVAATQFDRFQSQAFMTNVLRNAGVEPTFYLDDVTGGTSQGFADEAAGALDNFPTDIQWALYVDGEFLHLDGGTLELGIVRDSVLNSTNDYQVFGELFENVARIGPTQGALWITSTVCPSGEFPALATALSCGG